MSRARRRVLMLCGRYLVFRLRQESDPAMSLTTPNNAISYASCPMRSCLSERRDRKLARSDVS